jgi:DnaJ-class molecular chaperone
MTFENPILIIVACPACHGDGGHEHVTGFDPFNGSERVRFTRCDVCDGSGSVEEEVQPRTLEDLEQEDFDMLEAALTR